MNVTKCEKCGKLYGYRLIGTVYPGGKEKEYAHCPFCGYPGPSSMTSQTYESCKYDEKGNRYNDEN